MAQSTDAEYVKILLEIAPPMNNVINDQLDLNLVDICLDNTLQILCKSLLCSTQKLPKFGLQNFECSDSK